MGNTNLLVMELEFLGKGVTPDLIYKRLILYCEVNVKYKLINSQYTIQR
jgi:hypothetical protein